MTLREKPYVTLCTWSWTSRRTRVRHHGRSHHGNWGHYPPPCKGGGRGSTHVTKSIFTRLLNEVFHLLTDYQGRTQEGADGAKAPPPPKFPDKNYLLIQFQIRSILCFAVCTKKSISQSFYNNRCIKSFVGWGSAPDPAGGAYSTPPDPLAGFKGSYF